MFWKKNDAAIINRLDSLHGAVGANNDAVAELVADKLIETLGPKAELEISEQFDLALPRMVSEISNSINKRLNDAIDGVKAQSTGHLGAMTSAIFKTHNIMLSKAKDIEMRLAVVEGNSLETQTSMKRLVGSFNDALDQSNQNFEELGRTFSIFDAAAGDRMLTLYNKIRELEQLVMHKHMLTHTRMAAHYASISQQLADLKPKAREQYRVAPTVEWFIDNLDAMTNVAQVAELVRKNHIPRYKGVYELVKAIRRVHLYPIENLKHEVASKIESWDKLQDFCEAA